METRIKRIVMENGSTQYTAGDEVIGMLWPNGYATGLISCLDAGIRVVFEDEDTGEEFSRDYGKAPEKFTGEYETEMEEYPCGIRRVVRVGLISDHVVNFDTELRYVLARSDASPNWEEIETFTTLQKAEEELRLSQESCANPDELQILVFPK